MEEVRVTQIEHLARVAEGFRPHPKNISLAGGNALAALLWGTLHRAGGYPSARDRALRHIDIACENIGEGLNTSFYRGACGVAWTAGALATSLDNEDGIQIADEVAGVMTQAISGAADCSFDLIHGLAGVTVLARVCSSGARDALLDCCWQALVRTAGSGKKPGFSWIADARPSASSDNGADLGLAHGVPGVIAAFSAAATQSWNRPEVLEALKRGGAWLAAHSGATYRVGDSKHARLAWCYGHPSYAIAYFWLAALHPEFGPLAAQSARESLRVRQLDHHAIIDACLCHGEAGWGYLASRFGQACSQERSAFLSAAHTSLEAVRHQLGASSALKLPHFMPAAGWVELDTLLEGMPGVSLAMVSLDEPVLRAWEMPMLLDFPALEATSYEA